MLFHRSICFVLLSVIQLESIVGLTPSCKKNRFIDYSQVVETECIVEACIHYANCTLTETERCPCKRDFVVRYNVTTEHEDDEDDEHDDEDIIEGVTTHLGVITQHPDDEDMIVVGEIYPCFYDERDVATIFWEKPDTVLYYVLLTLSLILVFAIILVPIVYLILIIEFTNPEKKKMKK